jgi:hypothetical protein
MTEPRAPSETEWRIVWNSGSVSGTVEGAEDGQALLGGAVNADSVQESGDWRENIETLGKSIANLALFLIRCIRSMRAEKKFL